MSGGSLTDRCVGRWRGILQMLGVDSKCLSGKHVPCPSCGGKDRFRYTDLEGRGRWICSQCGAGDGFSLLMKLKGWDFKTCATEVEAIVGKAPVELKQRDTRTEQSMRDAMNRLWTQGNIVQAGDPVARYLEGRGIVLARYPLALRYVERCRYQTDDGEKVYYPAMIAKVTGPDGNPVTIHRTYLSGLGGKAEVESPRRIMPSKMGNGCAVRLGEAGDRLGVAEGIETALSASLLHGVPCWAAINAAMLMKWEPPKGVREVIVFGDNDPKFAGQSAAFALAHRLAVGGVSVKVEMPRQEGDDWNDVLKAA